MSERYDAWLSYLAQSESARAQTALLALGLMLTYFSISLFPERWQNAARSFYLTCGVPLFVCIMWLSLNDIALTPQQATPLMSLSAAIGAVFMAGHYGITYFIARRTA